jgi:hypothetical protein
VLALIAVTGSLTFAAAGELQVIRTYNVRDIALTVLSEAGQWTTGRNEFVLEIASATRKRLIPVVGPTLSATLSPAGKGALHSSASLAPAATTCNREGDGYVA